jgi:hypothetical protein
MRPDDLTTGQLRAIEGWDPQGSKADIGSNGSNPHGYCLAAGQVAFASDDAGLYLDEIISAGDASAACPAQWDASAYLAADDMTQPDQTMLVGYVQSPLHLSPPYTIEVVAEFDDEPGRWSVPFSLYPAASPGLNCELPDLIQASWTAGSTCSIRGYSEAGVPYFEVEPGENVSQPNSGFGFITPACTANSYASVSFTVPGVHDYMFRLAENGQGFFWLDGEFVFAFPTPYYRCNDGGDALPIEPVYMVSGAVPGGASGPYDAAAPPTHHKIRSWRVTSP